MSKSIKYWYVLSSNTSWANVEKAIVSGPYTRKEEAEKYCLDTSYWVEFLSKEEALELTY